MTLEHLAHTREATDVLGAMSVSAEGLTRAAVEERRARYGQNFLPRAAPPSAWRVFAAQFKSPLIVILIVAALVSALVGEHTDAGFIVAILVLNALIGGTQEWRAEQSAQALQQLVKTISTVVRDGRAREISAEELVPGDIVWLESGNRVPADLRLLTTQGLEVDEALLTGESVPAVKREGWLGEADAPVGDRQNMAYAGSIVARGRGRGVVVATGSAMVVGQLARQVQEHEGGVPPLVLRMERFTRKLGIFTLVISAAVIALGMGLGHTLVEMFMFSVALAVAAVPEGLPVAMTVALAVATQRMAARGVIVRKLAAVEGLGSCTLIASDKTGTLTRNELTAREIILSRGEQLEVSGAGYEPVGEVVTREGFLEDREQAVALARVAALCNEATLERGPEGEWTWRGDPTEVALLALAGKLGVWRGDLIAELPEVGAIPFEAERKFSATVHLAKDESGDALLALKGAPERILAMCALSDAERTRAHEVVRAQAARGMRLLGFAQQRVARASLPLDEDARVEGAEFLGFVAMIDPLREGVTEAIARCGEAGIKVIMVTGDHPATALAIARDLGLAQREEEVLSGADLEMSALHDDPARFARIRVFARVSPEQKLEIVEVARHHGHFVAVTGDGVNDAPALRAANIGVAMGRSGTDVAREASELVLSDDHFGTLVEGVEQGRIAYDNLRNVIAFLLSKGAAEIALVIASLIAGLPLPLLPVQLLWLNLVTNGIQDVALAFEPGESGVLQRAPRAPDEGIFDRLMWERVLLSAVVIGGMGLATHWYLLAEGWAIEEVRNVTLLLLVLCGTVHVGNCRSETRSIFVMPPWRSPVLLLGAAVALLLHFGSMHWSWMSGVLGVQPVSLGVLLTLAGMSLTLAAVMELHKLSWRLRQR